jgi:acyl-CoA synthetase (AMP-forming)/AMP-acid ligase II
MIIDAIARYAAEDPRRLAMIVNGAQVSYAELWRGIGILETRIKDAAIPRGARAGVAIADLRLAWFSLLALEKLGYPAFAVPQNARISQLSLANTGAILSDGRPHGTAVLDGGSPVIDVSSGGNSAAAGLGMAASRPELERYVLFSSGTTGLHKKVQLTSALRDARVQTLARRRNYSQSTRHFIGNLGPWTVHGYTAPLALWSRGGTIVIHQLADTPSAIAATKPDRLFVTPGLADDWLRQLGTARIDGRTMQISVGGGPLGHAQWIALQQAFPGASIRQAYGTTECGGISMTPVETAADLGRLALNGETQVQIVDPDGNPVPPGTQGAVRVRSETMVRQYLDDPAATAVFFRNGWFYPGDIGVIGADGRFSLTGRFAEVINVRGDKVPPGMIEDPVKNALNAREVAALSRPSHGQLDELHIFIVEGPPLTRETIEKALKPLGGAFSKIGVHKSERLPRNAMGKVLYAQLRTQLNG